MKWSVFELKFFLFLFGAIENNMQCIYVLRSVFYISHNSHGVSRGGIESSERSQPSLTFIWIFYLIYIFHPLHNIIIVHSNKYKPDHQWLSLLHPTNQNNGFEHYLTTFEFYEWILPCFPCLLWRLPEVVLFVAV